MQKTSDHVAFFLPKSILSWDNYHVATILISRLGFILISLTLFVSIIWHYFIVPLNIFFISIFAVSLIVFIQLTRRQNVKRDLTTHPSNIDLALSLIIVTIYALPL